MKWPRPGSDEARAAASVAAEERRARAREMGERLRAARIDQALTIEEVEATTRINRIYLEALEEGEYEALPAPVYARGFMRSYARFLSLDPEEAVAAVPRDLPRPQGLEPLPGLRRTASSTPLRPGLPAINLPVLGAAGAVLVVLVLAVFVIPGLGGGDGLDLPGATPTTTAVATPPGTTPTAPATGETPAAPTPPPSDATVPPFEAGTIPNFVGVSRIAAEELMVELGLIPLVFETPNQAPVGQVFQQVPLPGGEIEAGDTVTLFVSQGAGQ